MLEFKNISKSFFGVQALSDISFNINKGELIGLIGENGAGKSTLMNILGGVIQPDSGRIQLEGKNYAPENPSDASEAGIAFIHQELNLFSNLSIADNIYINSFPKQKNTPLIDRKKVFQRTQELLQSVELDFSPATLIEKLKPGERQLVEITKALNTGAEIIFFDEPTTSLTDRETERFFKIIEKLRTSQKTIIYISHNLTDVMALADSIVVLRDGSVVEHKAVGYFTIDRLVSCMVGRDLDQLYPSKSNIVSDKLALMVKNVNRTGIVKNINLSICNGEIVGLFGLMGSGRSELARMIFGLDHTDSGEIFINGTFLKKNSPAKSIDAGIAFITEDRRNEGLLMDSNVLDNMGLVSLAEYCNSKVLRIINKPLLEKRITEISDSLKIKSASFETQLAKNLSGGNQQKVVIGKWLLANPELFIMDEPTRGIDIGSKYEIYSIMNELAAKGTAILCISSELEELIAICDRIVVMSLGEILGSFTKEKFDKEAILKMAFREH